jgi:hypothetical protein
MSTTRWRLKKIRAKKVHAKKTRKRDPFIGR